MTVGTTGEATYTTPSINSAFLICGIAVIATLEFLASNTNWV
jgi:hypothetical protein